MPKLNEDANPLSRRNALQILKNNKNYYVIYSSSLYYVSRNYLTCIKCLNKDIKCLAFSLIFSSDDRRVF